MYADEMASQCLFIMLFIINGISVCFSLYGIFVYISYIFATDLVLFALLPSI